MPGADYRGTFDFAFGERAPAVAADIIDRVKFAIDIENSDGFAVNFDTFAAALKTKAES